MRVIAGKYRGRRIETVDDKKLRPTLGIAREAIFNILSHGQFMHEDGTPCLVGANVLDLFCGCGALSMEALSRGADHAVLMDIDADHLAIARHNLEKIEESDNCTFIRRDSSAPSMASMSCNLVFLDPPYKQGLADKALRNLLKSDWLADGAFLVVETGKHEALAQYSELEEITNRHYGQSRIRIFQLVSSPETVETKPS